MKKEVIIAITGASGVIYGIRIIEALNQIKEVKTHLIISNSGKKIIDIETNYSIKHVESLADKVYRYDEFTAPISSGSYKTKGMIVSPCSMKTLSSIANGISNNLISRVADVCLKEKRPLVLMIRETPINIIHVKNMEKVMIAGGNILPASPGFYHNPKTLDDIINFMAGKALDLIGIENNLYKRWK